MSDKYKVQDDSKAHFITITVVDWIDLFTRKSCRDVMVASLDFCRRNKGLEVYAWCLMPSHLHMICRAEDGLKLSNIIRDLKIHTSKQLIKTIQQKQESRREWLLNAFEKACEHLKRDQRFKVWQNGYHAEEIHSSAFLESKVGYLHQNPVRDGIVTAPEDYLYSSARNYAELDHVLDIDWLSVRWKTV